METKLETKLVRIDNKTHEIIRLEALRQSMKPNTVISMGDVIAQYAEKLARKKQGSEK